MLLLLSLVVVIHKALVDLYDIHFVTIVRLYVKLIIVVVDVNDTQYILCNKSAEMKLIIGKMKLIMGEMKLSMVKMELIMGKVKPILVG